MRMKFLLWSRGSNLSGLKRSVEKLNLTSEVCLKYSEKIAVVEKSILPSYRGRVRFQGSSWFAQCEKAIEFEPGERVFVVGRRNITLIVDSLIDRRMKYEKPRFQVGEDC